VAPHFAEAQRQAAERFHALQGTGKASGDLATVWEAATQGRVEVLFVDAESVRWGSPDDGSGTVRVAEHPGPQDYDLLDQAAVRALRSGATVYAGPPESVPGGDVIAAVFRY
jgi:hypothetical protein